MQEKDILEKIFKLFPENRERALENVFPEVEYFTSNSMIYKKILRLYFRHVYSKYYMSHDINKTGDDEVTYVYSADRLVKPNQGKAFVIKMILKKWKDKWTLTQYRVFKGKETTKEFVLYNLDLDWNFFQIIFETMKEMYDDMGKNFV